MCGLFSEVEIDGEVRSMAAQYVPGTYFLTGDVHDAAGAIMLK